MPKFTPSVLISDCWGSVGDLTFYHVDGRCYYKKKSQCEFPGTDAQNSQLDVHHRALAAWRTLEHSVQLTWNALAEPVISHKPPFDNTAHISGQNLFVSAYHGFYTLGDEHVPYPQAWQKFPVHSLDFEDAAVDDSDDGRVCIVVDDFRRRWDLDLDEYQVHGRYVLLDRQTGYRNIPREFSFSMKLV